MTPRTRLLLFLAAVVAILPGAIHVALHMPPFGAHPLPYGDLINRSATAERHVTNMVSAVNFDYRGFDTLGEEFMLLCAVTGVTVLLRTSRGEQADAPPGTVPGRPMPSRSEAVTLMGRLVGPVIFLFGVYVALHAMTTPGGGFQGGVIVASGFMLTYLGEGYWGWRRLMKSEPFDALEGGGAALYAIAGFAPVAMGLPFLANILPLGEPKDVFSGGLMLVVNAGVACAVAGGFAVLFIEFMGETRSAEGGRS